MEKTISIEPHWPGMRRYVLAMYETDPAKAREIASHMGREAPTFPDDKDSDEETTS